MYQNHKPGIASSTIVLWALICLSACSTAAPEKATIPRPNVVFILADDLGYGDLSFYNKESKIPTPHIDALATESIHFTDAHSPSAVCTPTRYGLLTGEYCWRTELKKGVLWTYDKPLIHKNKKTIARLFKESGYKTGLIGKWHLGWDWPLKEGSAFHNRPIGKRPDVLCIALEKDIDFDQRIEGGPMAAGFDYYFGVDVPNFPPYIFIENGWTVGEKPRFYKPDSIFGRYGLMQEDWELNKILPTLNQKAKSFIFSPENEQQNTPFFLFYALTAPHTPIVPNRDFSGRSEAGDIGDFIVETDHYVGEIIQHLKDLNLYDNTIIIFTSDNGAPAIAGNPKVRGKEWGQYGSAKKLFGHDSSHPFRGIKGDIWEGGHRVPLIIRWKGQVAPNSVNHEMVCLMRIKS